MSKLYVDEIRPKTAGKQVTMPEKPSFHVRLNTAKTTQNFTTLGDVPFDTIDHNIGSCVAITNEVAVFTAPVDGVYHFSLNVSIDSLASANWVSTSLYIDNAQTGGSEDKSYRNLEDGISADYQTAASSFTIQLNANQTVQPKLQISGDSSVSIRAATRFSGFLIG